MVVSSIHNVEQGDLRGDGDPQKIFGQVVRTYSPPRLGRRGHIRLLFNTANVAGQGSRSQNPFRIRYECVRLEFHDRGCHKCYLYL